MHELDVALQACINGEPDIAENILLQKPQNDPRVAFNLGWHNLRHGDLQKGLQMMDIGRRINVYGSPPIPNLPIWQQDDLVNKTVILRGEGGLGDEIINARFVKQLSNRGAKVIISCHRSLARLFSKLNGVSAVISDAATIHVYADCWIPAMSAPWLLGYDFTTLPNDQYIFNDRQYNDKWSNIIDGKLKVGIRWAGNPKFEHEQHRQFPPDKLFQLSNIQNVKLYSLQRDTGREQLPKGMGITDLGDHLITWEETAGVIANLDLIITSCTSVAHLAAAMGKPTWVIIPIMPYYIWAYPWNGTVSPWYKSVRLFRQTKYGTWDDPLDAVKIELLKLVETTTMNT